ncbi:MAG TPA: VOC family protein [Polyangia bacterium]|nr:VOC family protein [Polyangia bacterium]
MATKAKRSVPEGYHTVTAGLICAGAGEAIKWYQKAIGAEQKMRMDSPDGKVMHAELRIGDSLVYVNDPMMGKDAKALGGSPVTLNLYVDDCDAVFNRAVQAGAKASMPPADMFWGDRFGSFVDPFGHTWSVMTHKEDVTPDEMRTRQAEWMKQMAQQKK